MSPVCFLVFGVSGVGKSTACEKFAAAHPEYAYTRASALLANAAHRDPEVLRTAPVDRILATQSLLPPALERFRQRYPESGVLLDCHAVIDNDNSLVEVPLAIIEALEPSGLLLLEASPETVAARRKRDHRERPERTLDQIRRELESERDAVSGYARALNVPMEAVEVTDNFSLEAPLHRLTVRLARAP